MGADLYINGVSRDQGGYFRDAYNDGNLLWKFKISYWKFGETTGIEPTRKEEKYDGCQYLTPKQTRQFLKLLKDRKKDLEKFLNEELTEEWLEDHHCVPGVEEWREHYREKYDNLLKFLEKALEVEADILMSV